MTAHRRMLWLLAVVVATSVLPAAGPPLLRRVDVPADRPDLWPEAARTLVAVPRDEFEKLWAAAQPQQVQPPVATLEDARYFATASTAALGEGHCIWRVRRHAALPVWLSLGTTNLVMRDLRWGDRPALWGADAEGQLWLRVDVAEGELTGAWSLSGRVIADETRFRLEVPTALATAVTITTPAQQVLHCDDAPLRGGDADEEERVWDIALGSRTTCQLRLSEQVAEAQRRRITYRRQQLGLIREDHVKFQTIVSPEILEGNVDELQFSVPTSVELLAATWGGELPLAWTREKSTGPRSLVTVRLPDRVAGAIRPIHLEGLSPRRRGTATTIPEIELQDGVFVSGDVLVTVARPLEVVAVRATGCRQQAPVSSSSEGEMYRFRQSQPGALLTFEVRSPRSSLAAQVMSVVTVTDDVWTQETEVAWRSNSGTAFQLGLRLPAGWEMIDIDAFTAAGIPERITWERQPEADGATKIAVELLEALRPEAPLRLSIWSRRRPVEEGNAFECPAVRPLDCQSLETIVAFRGEGRYWLTASPGEALRPIEPDRLLAATWNTFPLWVAAKSDGKAVDSWFHSDRNEAGGWLQLERRPLPVTADIAGRTRVDRDAVVEEFRLRVQPDVAQATERLLVFVSQPGGDITWQVEQPAGTQVLARRWTGDRRQFRELPPGGELWELRMPPLSADEAVILGTRAQPLSLPVHVGLAWLPQATVISATATVETAESLGLQPSSQRLDSVSTSSGTLGPATVRHWEWRYSDPHSVLTLASRRQGLADTPGLAALELRSLIAANQEAYDYHQADASIPALDRPVRWQLPGDAEVLSMELDGVRLSGTGAAALSIPTAVGARDRRWRLLYRTPHRRGFLRDRSPVVVPSSPEVAWTGVRWEFFLPPSARLADEPLGVRLERPLPAVNWTTRLFGPLGRPVSQSVFWPWSLASWRQLSTAVPSPAPAIAPNAAAALSPPTNWQGYVAYAPTASDISLITWHAGRLRLLAWLGLLLTFTLAVMLRLWGWGLRDYAAALWLAVLGGIALTWAGPTSELIGGVIAGTVFAVLLPRRWLAMKRARPAPRKPMGSTQSFQLPVGLQTMVVVGLSGVVAWNVSQAEDTLWQPRTTVLVPVDSDGQPSRRVPLVYLHPETLNQLRNSTAQVAATPAWLMQSAEYEVTASPGQRWPLTATLTVLVLDPQPQVTLPLRVTGASLTGPRSCLVDGQPAAVTVDPMAGELQLTWTRDDRPVSALGDDLPTQHVITLRLQTPWQRVNGEVRPATLFPLAPRSQWTLMASPAGATATDLVSSVQTIGPVADDELAWTDPLAPVALPTKVDIDVTEVWNVHATLVEARTRSIIQPRSGPLRRLIVDLPPQAALERLEIQPEARVQYLTADATSRPAVIEFVEPLFEPATIELSYVAPHATADGEFFGRGLLFRAMRTRAILPQVRRWAISSPSDIRVEPQALENSGLAPVSRASVHDALAGLTGERTPQAIYQVQGEAPIPFRWTPIVSRRQLLLWQQTGTLERDRLKWELEGELEVVGAPVYSHVLSIDRRLRIESITVRERGADRLARWSETRFPQGQGSNRITLFLTDPCLESQRITLVATAAVAPEAPLPLPNVRCDDAELRGGRLLFTASEGTNVTWSSTRGLRNLNSDPGDAPSPSTGTTWIFDQTETDWRATIRVHRTAGAGLRQWLQTLQADGDDRVRLTVRSRFPWTTAAPREDWLFPAPWVPVGSPASEGAAIETAQQPTGDWQATAIPTNNAGLGEMTWQFSAPRAALSDNSLPLPRWSGEHEGWLAEVTAPPVAPLLIESESNAPPDWAQRWLSDALPLRSSAAHWLSLAGGKQSIPVQATAGNAGVSIAWLEHVLFRGDSSTATGATLVRTARPCHVLSVRFPNQSRFRAALVDGQPAIATSSADQVLRIAATAGTEFSELRLFWDQVVETVAGPLSQTTLVWPDFPESSISQQAIGLYPAPDEALRPAGRWQPGDWVDRALLRLETLGDLLPASGDNEYLERKYLSGYALLAEKLGRQPEILERGGSQRAARWQTIVETTNHLGRQASATNPIDFTIAEQLVDHPVARWGMTSENAVGLTAWRIDREWARWLLRCLAVLTLWPLLRSVVRRDFSEWLQRHPQIATAVLGLVWWLCLTPSLVGFALVMFALVQSLRALRRSDVVASTVAP